MKRSSNLAYYVGAYGPTIRMATQAPEELSLVGRLFAQLATGQSMKQDVIQALNWQVESLASLIAKTVSARRSKALAEGLAPAPQNKCPLGDRSTLCI